MYGTEDLIFQSMMSPGSTSPCSIPATIAIIWTSVLWKGVTSVEVLARMSPGSTSPRSFAHYDFKLLVIAEPFLNGLTPPTSSSSIEGNGLFRAKPFFTDLTSPTSSSLIEGNGLICIVLRTEAEGGTKEEQPSSVGGRVASCALP